MKNSSWNLLHCMNLTAHFDVPISIISILISLNDSLFTCRYSNHKDRDFLYLIFYISLFYFWWMHELKWKPLSESNLISIFLMNNIIVIWYFAGRTQAVDASKTLEGMGFMPTFIWASNTERSYETAAIIARESNLGQNRYGKVQYCVVQYLGILLSPLACTSIECNPFRFVFINLQVLNLLLLL